VVRQYAGDHYKTWGGVMLNIDDNVLDGVVAVPFFGTPSPDFFATLLSSPPLTVRFTIANTAFLSSCTWDYGDGQTGSSCAHISTHTYASAGTYSVSLTAGSSWGKENLTSRLPLTSLPIGCTCRV
jgi:PKD repeat protein